MVSAKSFSISIFLLVLPLSSALAQSSDSPNYFPLEVGNSWQYIWVVDPPNLPADTTFQEPFEVTASLAVNELVYFVAPHLYGFADTLRQEEDGRVFARFGGNDVLLYDFTLEAGESYDFIVSENSYENYTVTIERGLTVDVGAGRFDNVVRLNFRTQVSDSDRIFEFAPDVGLVAAYDGWGIYQQLLAAVVDGRVIAAIEDDGSDLLPSGRAFAYPNPFRESATIFLPRQDAARETATVYDVLGRPVASLAVGDCSIEGCSFRWDAQGAPNGVYFVIADGGHGQVVNLMLAR